MKGTECDESCRLKFHYTMPSSSLLYVGWREFAPCDSLSALYWFVNSFLFKALPMYFPKGDHFSC